MKIYIVGIGTGSKDEMTDRAVKIIESSDMIIGHRRMLDLFSHLDVPKENAYLSKDIEKLLENTTKKSVSILVSGDIGFFSATKKLLNVVKKYNYELVPGISSIVYFSSKLGLSWDDMKIISLHGREKSLLGSIGRNKKIFLLTGGENTVEKIINDLYTAKVEDVLIHVGENLSYENEKLTTGDIKSLLGKEFSSLSVMVIENKSIIETQTQGIPDEEFTRGKVPMTKSEVRSIVLSKLKLKEDDVIYDVGSGTGSVSIEMALTSYLGEVYSIEKNSEGVDLTLHNREKFKAYNIRVIEGIAPKVLEKLPKPNKVFIGGSSGNIEDIISLCFDKNPNVRIVVTAVAVESISKTFEVFKKLKISNVEIVQVSISKAKVLGGYNMMMGQNPVYIFSGEGREDD